MTKDVAINFLKQTDPILGQLIEQIGPCQLDAAQQHGDLFSSLSKAIIHQQLSTKAAASIYRRFLQLYPNQSFPTALDILNAQEELLREVGLSRAKVLYLKDLAQNILDGLPTIVELEAMDDETIIHTLIQVKGVGRWTAQMLLIFRTAQMLLIFRLNRQNVLPVDDLGIRASIRRVYSLNELPDKQTILRLGQRWQPYCTVASWYLWRSLEL